jgi:hypothetical protein
MQKSNRATVYRTNNADITVSISARGLEDSKEDGLVENGN